MSDMQKLLMDFQIQIMKLLAIYLNLLLMVNLLEKNTLEI